MEDPVVKIKRGRGRPSKNEPVIHWSDIERGRQVWTLWVCLVCGIT
jgi:hypothetical protein